MRFLEISPWVERPADLAPPLEGEVQADVVVVGGGYTGLSTALCLREEGVDVALLESDFAGSGASGRNAGHLTPTIGKDLPTLLRLYGRQRAAALVRFADRAVEHTAALIEKLGIDCDYAPSGNVLAGLHPRHVARLRRAADTGAELGARVRFLDNAELRARGLPEAFCCGVLEELGGTLHPGRYVSGLRRAALRSGVRLYEQTPVRGIEDGPPSRVRAGQGSVRAERVVLATNAYTPALGWLRRRVAPLRVSLFETEALGAERLARLGWPGREGIYTAHEILESYRLTAHGTLVGGSKVVRYRYGSRLDPGRREADFRCIEGAFRERFPQLGDLPVAHFWGGWIACTLDFLPCLGTTGRGGTLHYGLGYAGHGVAQATLMGRLLADRVLGREGASADALERRVFSWPPEPLRWLGYRAITGALGALDRRTDRQVRALSPVSPPSNSRA